MARSTFNSGVTVTVAAPVRLLGANARRVLYSIQNHDVANYIALSPSQSVTAGVYGRAEGQHLAQGQPMSDNCDKSEVWAIANTADVYVTVVEITDFP